MQHGRITKLTYDLHKLKQHTDGGRPPSSPPKKSGQRTGTKIPEPRNSIVASSAEVRTITIMKRTALKQHNYLLNTASTTTKGTEIAEGSHWYSPPKGQVVVAPRIK